MIRNLAIVTACYAAAATGIGLLFLLVETTTGKPIVQRDVSTAVFWVLCAMAWAWSFAEMKRPQRSRR